VNNDINNIQHLRNLSTLDFINKDSSLKLNAGLPPTYNFVKKSNLRGRGKEESINGNLINILVLFISNLYFLIKNL
jgi:hypothetical protein